MNDIFILSVIVTSCSGDDHEYPVGYYATRALAVEAKERFRAKHGNSAALTIDAADFGDNF